MTAPLVVVQLSDPHLGADWGPGDPVAGLAAAVGAVGALPSAPDAVLVTGDLADHATDAEYAQVRGLLERLGAPLVVLPGNHDDRAALRRHFGTPGEGDAPVQYAVDLGPLRLVAVDTTGPTEEAGELGPDRLAWLDAELARAPGVPTLVAMHHPPVRTGLAAADASGVPDGARAGLAAVVARHPQVRRILAGHAHRPLTAELAGRPVVVAPSTFAQARLALGAEGMELAAAEPAGFAVHALLDGAVVSHLQPVV